MTGAALFDLPGPPPGLIRRALDKWLDELRADGARVPEDLAIVAQMLANRVDQANAAANQRGYVMLSAEYRAARHDLLEGITTDVGAGPDPLAVALAEFRAATATDDEGSIPNY